MITTDSDFETKVSLEKEANPIPDDPPFHILFMGDYSGRNISSNKVDSTAYQIYEIDRDNFEDILDGLKVSVQLDITASPHDFINLDFACLDDFHPDNIFQKLNLFSDLRNLRERLSHPRTFENAALEVRSWFKDDQKKVSSDEYTKISETESSGDLLDDILSGTKTEATTYQDKNADTIGLGDFIKDIVKPHIIQTDEVEQAKLIALVDEATTELMRKILHHPKFQALESAWRGLYYVVRHTDTSTDLKLFLMDISKSEIATDLSSVKDLSDSNLFNTIVYARSQTNTDDPFALICGNYEFELTVQDAATLIRLAKIGNTITAPFISTIKPQMLGIESLFDSPSVSDWNTSDESSASKLWATLRTFPQATNLGMIFPKFLSRLPFGKNTEPTQLFSFEEFADIPEHQKYLWSNASYLFALLLAQTYKAFGWEFGSRIFDQIDNLPIHIYTQDEASIMKSCTEINMTHDACDALIEQGLIPLISFKNSDSAKIADFQSISFPAKLLNGRWS